VRTSRVLRTPNEIDYAALAAERSPTSETWDAFVPEMLEPAWLTAYRAQTTWSTEIQEIRLDALVFLFDAAPTLKRMPETGDDRLVAVWGRSRLPAQKRDRSRMAGLLPTPRLWSGSGLDRGHFVAHDAGGGLDLNLFPQLSPLNRGWSQQGRRWRQMERYAARHPGTPLFVRPIYRDDSWRPSVLEFGLLTEDNLRVERFSN
jgi:hypothetical protein